MAELVRSAHSVGEFNGHLVLTPAYRRAIFAHPLVRELTTGYLVQKAMSLGVRISALEYGPDHLHLFVENWRRYAPSELARPAQRIHKFHASQRTRVSFRKSSLGA